MSIRVPLLCLINAGMKGAHLYLAHAARDPKDPSLFHPETQALGYSHVCNGVCQKGLRPRGAWGDIYGALRPV